VFYGLSCFVQGADMTVMLVFFLAVQAAGLFLVCYSFGPVFAQHPRALVALVAASLGSVGFIPATA
jgi:hypothetical protein